MLVWGVYGTNAFWDKFVPYLLKTAQIFPSSSEMNFLAHLYLSGEFDELMVGNFMADFVKGNPASTLTNPRLIQGVSLHRHIDSFTDQHPIVRLSKQRLQPAYHKYASVIVDVFYDHFLANLWLRFSPVPLADFARQVYQLMNENKALLPAPMHQLLWYMERQNWLLSYAQIKGIARTLHGLSRRATFQSNMELAILDLERDYELYQNEFLQFFPELIAYVQTWKNERLSG